jgi:hypothetical protein
MSSPSVDNYQNGVKFNRPYAVLFDGNRAIVVNSHERRLAGMHRRVYAWGVAVMNAMLKVPGSYLAMVGLTYDPKLPNGRGTWRPNHIKDYMGAVRQQCGKGLLGYAWVAELQGRGEVHYHIMLWLARGSKVKKPDQRGGGWSHGASRVQRARSPFYLVKYAKKVSQKRDAYPKHCRMYGVSLPIGSVSEGDKLMYRLSSAPACVRTFVNGLAREDVAGIRWARTGRFDDVGGWWVWHGGGKTFLASAWDYVSAHGSERWAYGVADDMSVSVVMA